MWVAIFVIASFIGWGNSCAPAGGEKISASPTFSFAFYPPVSWTYSDNTAKTATGQWGNAEDAQKTMKSDVNSAMKAALKKSGYEGLLSSAKYDVTGYIADKPFPIGTDPGDYVVELGAVTKQIVVDVTGGTETTEKIEGTTPTVAVGRKKRDNSIQIRVVDPGTPTQDNVQNFQLKVVNSPTALSTDQWSILAQDAYTILSVRYKVHFVSPDITVTA